jgi:hypothetical protein
MRHRTTPLLALAALLTACGGSQAPTMTPVEQCVSDLRPALLACVPADYRGVDATPISACVAANPDLTFNVVQCRSQSPDEFTRLLDHMVGHAAAYALSRL